MAAEGEEEDGSFSLISFDELVTNGVEKEKEDERKEDILLVEIENGDQTKDREEILLNIQEESHEAIKPLDQQQEQGEQEIKDQTELVQLEIQREDMIEREDTIEREYMIEREDNIKIHENGDLLSDIMQTLENQGIVVNEQEEKEIEKEQNENETIQSFEGHEIQREDKNSQQQEEYTEIVKEGDNNDMKNTEEMLELEQHELQGNKQEEEYIRIEDKEEEREEIQIEEEISPLEQREKESEEIHNEPIVLLLEQTEMEEKEVHVHVEDAQEVHVHVEDVQESLVPTELDTNNINTQQEDNQPLVIEGNEPLLNTAEKEEELIDSLEEPENYKPIEDEVYDFDVPDEYMDISFNLIPPQSTSVDSDSFDLDTFLGIPKHLPPPSTLVSSNVETTSHSESEPLAPPTFQTDETQPTQEAPPNNDNSIILSTPFCKDEDETQKGLSDTHSVIKISPILQQDNEMEGEGEIKDERKLLQDGNNNATFDTSPVLCTELNKLKTGINENTNSTFTINGESPGSNSDANITGPSSTDSNITGPSSTDSNITGPTSTDVPTTDTNTSGPSTAVNITGPSNVSSTSSVKSEECSANTEHSTSMPKLKGSMLPTTGKLVKRSIKPHPQVGGTSKLTQKSKMEGQQVNEERVKSKLTKGTTTGIKRPTSAGNTKTATTATTTRSSLKPTTKTTTLPSTKPTGIKTTRPVSAKSTTTTTTSSSGSSISSKTTIAKPTSTKTSTITSTKSTGISKPTRTSTTTTTTTKLTNTRSTTTSTSSITRPTSGSIKSTATSIKPASAKGATKPSGIPPPVKKTRSTIIPKTSTTITKKEVTPKTPPTKSTARLVAPKKVGGVKSKTTVKLDSPKVGDSEDDLISLPSNQSTPIATPPRRRTIGTPSRVSETYVKNETTPPHNKRRSMIPTPSGKTVRDSDKSIKPIPYDDGEHIVRRVAQPRLLKGLAPPKGGAKSKLTRPVKGTKLKEEPVETPATNEDEVPVIVTDNDVQYEEELLSNPSSKPKVVHSPINKENLPATPHSEWSPIQRKKTVLPEDECLQCTKYTYKINSNNN